jgi:ornithine cyclodeaminase/alanine dehydrogenase-like protein (mu-crystallin family)
VSRPTLVLTRRDIARLMRPSDYLEAVEAAFRAAADGRGASPAPMHLPVPGGGFHVKGAGFGEGELTAGSGAVAAFKVNGNIPSNPARRGLPTIQGAIVLCDAEIGEVLALMDSIEVTLQRTAAATAAAARHLARPGSEVVTICGCGEQGRAQLQALREVLPLKGGYLFDLDGSRAATLAQEARTWGLAMEAVGDLAVATRRSDVVVTCTPAREPFLTPAHVTPGAFIAAVGADAPDKGEIAPELMAEAAVVVDVLDQCLAMGDLRRAVAAGAMTAAQVRASLGEVLTGRRTGRADPMEIVVFDSTGTAIQDVASAAVIHERACEAGRGLAVDLGAP